MCIYVVVWMLLFGELVGGYEDVGCYVVLDKLLGCWL